MVNLSRQNANTLGLDKKLSGEYYFVPKNVLNFVPSAKKASMRHP